MKSMKSVKANQVMLSFLMYVSIIIVLGFLLGKPENIDNLSSFMYAILLMSGIGITAFFMREKDAYFKNGFLISYFGVILFLIVFNITNIIYDPSDNVIISVLIIGFLLYHLAYPLTPLFAAGSSTE